MKTGSRFRKSVKRRQGAPSVKKNPDVADKIKVFHKGHVIYKEGQVGSEAYLVKQGAVALYRLSGNRRVNLGVLGPGKMFGQMGVVSGETRTDCAEALEYTEVFALDQTLLQTLLLKSPRPVQIMTTYLAERVAALKARVEPKPFANTFASICHILLLCHRAAQASQPKTGPPTLSSAELSRTIKDILLVSQVEIDDVFDKLAKLHVIDVSDVLGAHYRKDPLLGGRKKTGQFIKERQIVIPDADRFAQVTRNMAKETAQQDANGSDLVFIDLADFAKAVESTPEIILKKIAYGEIPESVFFFHKAQAMLFAEAKGLPSFQKARRPRLRPQDMTCVDDVVAVDNATLTEALSRLGFYKVGVLCALAGDEARTKLLGTLSKKIASVVEDEMSRMGELDPAEAADIEDELLTQIKTMKGLHS